jgi:drug/metabolite transporter (DMT)-like permease
MAALLAVTASVLYGSADFLGGLASRKNGALTVSALAQLIGLSALAVAVLVSPAASPRPTDLAWGAAAGVAGAFALGLFYYALSIGRMSVVAPVAAATGDLVAVLVGFAAGERPSPIVLLGIALALVSIALVGQEGPGAPRRRPVFMAILSGIAIGAFYACFRYTSPAAGVWPLVMARAVSLPMLLVAARSIRVPRRALAIIIPCGVLDIAANVCYLDAVRHGSLSVIATLASLYPAVTAALAWWILRERLRLPQYVGLAFAGVAIVMISLG